MTFYRTGVLATVLLAGIGFGATNGSAAPLFSVDISTHELVRVESSTGAVTVVGALGVTAFDIDLTRTADGRLWGLNSQIGSRVDLLEIDQLTGAVISSTQVTLPTGANLRGAEGLGHAGNQLTIVYSPAGNSNSNTFGNLSTGGAISGPVGLGFDVDGLSAGAGGVPYYTVDRTPAVSNIVYALDPSGPSASIVASFPDTLAPNDLVRIGDDILMIDNATAALRVVDLNNTTAFDTIALDRSGTYLGLALAGPLQVPEVASLTLLATGLAGLGIAARRRSRR